MQKKHNRNSQNATKIGGENKKPAPKTTRLRIISVSLVVFALVLSCVLLSACKKSDKWGVDDDVLASYDIVATYDDAARTLTCFQDMQWINRTDTTLSELPLHLYANAFQKDAIYPAISQKKQSECYYAGESYGGIEITYLSVEGLDTPVNIGGIDENLLLIPLSNLAPNHPVNIEIEYVVTLPKCTARLGITQNTVNLGNFYPVAAAYQNGSFILDPYYSIGDPFMGVSSDFFFTLTAPDTYTAAVSGQAKSSYTESGMTTTEFEAPNVRDFAAVLSNKFLKVSDRVDGIDVHYYYFSDNSPKTALNTAVSAIKTFNVAFGKYPWKTYSVAQTDFIHGGMEYPGLAYVASDLTADPVYHETIVHETAHQWWYCAVGNNQVNEAWLDEGLADFSTALYFKLNADDGRYTYITDGALATYSLYVELAKLSPTDMTRALPQYASEMEYVVIAYYKGSLMFQSVYEIAGEKQFLKSLKAYYSAYKHDIATADNLIACFKKNCKVDIVPVFDAWISGKVILF